MHARVTAPEIETEISEIFSSLQGEGPYLGVKQIFVRFGRCNMHCVYCDELEKMKEGAFSVQSLEQILARIDQFELENGPHHSISLTGGEPLFYSRFLRNFLPKLKERGLATYLETNGVLPRELSTVIKWCDIIAMDLKPPTSTEDRPFWDEHEEFLKIAVRKNVFIKVVVTARTSEDDIRRCARILKAVNPSIPFILQPQTDGRGPDRQAMGLIESSFYDIAKSDLTDVRVIPQMHKIWGVR